MTDTALPRSQAAATQAQPQIVVPERPRLAPGVLLHGEMTESAYQQPPWLIERNGAYLPVSRLLHAVAAAADGRSTLGDMAERVADEVERQVTTDDVRLLVANLMLSGIVAQADGTVAETPTAQAAAPSPLTVNMRMTMFSPRIIDVGSRIFQVLFWPPVILAVLAAGAAAQVWMYAIHGIGGSLHQALYAPGFVLLVLGAIVIAAGFHEFGHASALRYGGGRAKAMGVGVYLFYPAFYTDVSDNYRLSRWSRLRTDLGGFYFHLIFALGVIGLYFVTGWEPLLLIVVLINLEIIHQLMPFVRLDGYWTLADMTGIPDFFSHMGPFLRSLLPFLKSDTERKVPELRTWAKVVFIIYILITIPVLLFVLIHLVVGLPRVLGTAWDSFWQQWSAAGQSVASGDGLAVAGSAVQMLVLVVMTLGLCYFLFSLARNVVRKGWEWSRPTWPRRLAAAGATVALTAVLVLLFAPVQPLSGRPGPFSGAIDLSPIEPDEPLTIVDMSSRLMGGSRRLSDGGVDGQTDGSSGPTATPPPSATPGGPTPTPAATPTRTTTPASSPAASPSSGSVASPSPSPSRATSASTAPSSSPSPTPTPTPTPGSP